MPSEQLPHAVFDDIARHFSDKVSQALIDACDLVEHPKQRSLMVESTCAALVMVAAKIIMDCYHRDTGKKISEDTAIHAVLSFCHRAHCAAAREEYS